MRIFSLTILVLALVTANSFAQYSKFSLNVIGGYTFKDKVNFDNAYAYVNEAVQYGGALEFFTQRTKSIELSYQRMGTDMPLFKPSGEQLNTGAAAGSVNYILIGGNNYFMKSNKQKAIPYVGAGLGLGILNAGGESSTKFAWNAKAGLKIKTSSVVSFKVQAYVQSVISTFGSDFFVTGGGAVITTPNYVTLFQFGLGGAICIDFPGK